MFYFWLVAVSFLCVYCKVTCSIERPSLSNPDGIERHGCGNPEETTRLLALATSLTTAKIKIKAPAISGSLNIQIQSKNLNISSETFSESFAIELKKDRYKISNGNSILFQKDDFDFSGQILDGVLIRKEGKIQPSGCYTFDGVRGEIITENCFLFN